MSEFSTAEELDFDRLGPDVTAAFAKNGVVCLRNLLPAAELEDLRGWMEIAIANPSERFINRGDSKYIVDTHLWPKFEGFRKIAFESRLAEAAATVMGSSQVQMFNDTMFIKEPSAPEPTPWHHDLPYMRLGGPNNCSAWIALDPANAASGAMTYALGSHRWGKMFMPVNLLKPDQNHADEGFDGPAPDLDANPEICPTVGFTVQPGDVVFHHLLTLHKAGPNTSAGTRRRVHTIRFAGDESIWLDRAFSTVELDCDLPSGAPLAGRVFPVLWPKQQQSAAAHTAH